MNQVRLFRLLSKKSSVVSSVIVSHRTSSLLAYKKKKEISTFQPLLHAGDTVPLRLRQLKSYNSIVNQSGIETSVATVNVDPNLKHCLITWEDGFHSQFHSAWLRHNCHCKDCRHSNGQKLLDPSCVSSGLLIESAEIQDNILALTWYDEDTTHNGCIPISFLRMHNYNTHTIMDRREHVKPQPTSEIPKISYEDIAGSKDFFYRWLRHINEEGLCVVNDVPLKEDMVVQVAEMIGPVMPTIYGSTFDVKHTIEQINVAYSSLPIGLHQDLVYYESPPGLQLLHCLEFDESIEGGDSSFVDVFDVTDKFRIAYPDLFQTLTEVPATFQKIHYHRDLPVHLVNQKPHIKVNHLGEICAVYWAPPFEGPLAVISADVERYFLAYEMFAKALEDATVLRHRMRSGDLVIFNNLRMLHGRGGFSSATNGGLRRFKGCYLNIDIFKSQVQVLHNLLGDGRLVKRVGNQCWF